MASIPFKRFFSRIAAISLLTGTLVLTVVAEVRAAGPSRTMVAMGESHAVAVGTDGTVWTWGSLVPGPRGEGSRYSLPRPTRVSIPGSRDVINVATTRQSSVALAADGTVWAWGYLGIGLGDASSTRSSEYLAPVQVSFGSTRISKVSGDCEGYIAIDTNGDVWQWGSFWGVWSLSSSRPVKVPGVSGAVNVARSCSTAYAVLSDGTVRAWGSNGGGKLGDGTTTDRQVPVPVSVSGKQILEIAVSESHAIALASDGSVWGWGSNNQSQLAADPAAIQYSTTPRRIVITGATGSVVSIAATSSTPSSFAVMSSGEVWEWGNWSPSAFAPRQRNLPVSDLGSSKLTHLSAYYQNMMFVGTDNSIWAKGQWGQYSSVIDGNCGSDAYEYTQWINGRTIPPKYLVRVMSNGQFGAAYNEDSLSIRSLATSTGTLLPLDGSGTAVGRQNGSISIIATAPASACYNTSQLTVTWDFNGDGVFETNGVASTNEGESAINTGTYTFDWSGRRRGAVKITNPDGVSQTYSFWMGVAATASSGGGGPVSVLPIAESSNGTTISLGTDGFVYGWGKETAVLGTTSVTPKRLLPGSSTTYSKLVFTRGRSASQFSVVAAMTSAGLVQAWGRSPGSQLFFNGSNQPLNETLAPYSIPFPSGVTRWLDLSIEVCRNLYSGSEEVFIKLIGNDQQLYVHGVGSFRCAGSASRIPTAPSVATGLAFSQFGPGKLIKGSDGWKIWQLLKIGTRQGGSCWSDLSSCATAPIEYYGPTSAIPSLSYVPGFDDDSQYCYYGSSWTALEISAVGQVESVVRSNNYDRNGCYQGLNGRGSITEVSRTNISNWSNRTAVAIGSVMGRWGERTKAVIASDGTYWEWQRWSQNQLRMIPLDSSMSAPRRFAGNSNYVVTSDSALWTIQSNDWDVLRGSSLGSCAVTKGNDQSSSVRVFSSGQFGTVFSEDRFGFQVDAPELLVNEQFIDQGYIARENDWSGSPSVSLRPNSSGQLYGYVSSSCNGANVTRVEWDMNDDGIYESLGTITTITANATPITTRRVNRYGEVTYDGFDTTWKQVLTPSMDLSTPGGRYIGVKLTSASGTQTKRFTVLVQPKKPVGYVGATINGGARFTESVDVQLTLNWPEGATTALISNDGGFMSAQEVPLSRTVRWKLPSTGNGQLGTNVYVRYYELSPDGRGSWNNNEIGYQVSDDIVLDLAAPTVSNVTAATSQALAAALRMDGIARSMVTDQFGEVTISAYDAASGISGMQVASDPAVPGPVLPYSGQVRIPIDRERVAVRVQDNVGHWSPWTYARVSNFVAPPVSDTPSQVVPTPTPVAPTPGPATPAPTPAAPVVVPVSPSPVATPTANAPTAKAVLTGTTARVSVSVPASLAKTCTTKIVKAKKITTCVSAQITVSVSGGATKKVSARSGSNSISIPKVKKGQTVTVKVGSRVISRIRLK